LEPQTKKPQNPLRPAAFILARFCLDLDDTTTNDTEPIGFENQGGSIQSVSERQRRPLLTHQLRQTQPRHRMKRSLEDTRLVKVRVPEFRHEFSLLVD